MAIKVDKAGFPELTAEDAAAMRAEIRNYLEEVERLHAKMQEDDTRAEASQARRQAMLESLKAEVRAAFGNGPV